ncbi:MAG TPA: hypothetical protein VE987_16475 [Polyangiaceae bacterium]|nr:hypothetical protein [Polyangiaceae bacterium]
MPFTRAGSDIAMRRNPATGKLDFDWDETGNPRYSDDNVHRVLSLLIEHRPAPGPDGGPGWIWDRTGKRGSLLYTVKNVRRSTPSQLEAFGMDALQKAVDEGWIKNPTVKAFLQPATSARLEVSWQNVGGRPSTLRVPLV